MTEKILGCFETLAFVYAFAFQVCNSSFSFQIYNKLGVSPTPAYTDPTLMKTLITKHFVLTLRISRQMSKT